MVTEKNFSRPVGSCLKKLISEPESNHEQVTRYPAKLEKKKLKPVLSFAEVCFMVYCKSSNKSTTKVIISNLA